MRKFDCYTLSCELHTARGSCDADLTRVWFLCRWITKCGWAKVMLIQNML